MTAVAFEAIVNRGEYISAHYLAEIFSKDLVDLRKRWTAADRAGRPTSRSGMRNLGRDYFKAKVRITEKGDFDGSCCAGSTTACSLPSPTSAPMASSRSTTTTHTSGSIVACSR